MTRVEIDDLVVRVWSTVTSYDTDVEEARHLRVCVALGMIEGRATKAAIFEALEAALGADLAAAEVLKDGQGIVLYPDWN